MSNNQTTAEVRSNLIARTFASAILYRNFRLLWMGSWTEHLGEWMEITALLWLINQMTHSPFMATLMVTLRYLPMIVFAYIGGIIADRINRRALLVYALSAAAVFSIVLAALAYTGLLQVWHLLLYSALTGVYTSFNHPARSTLLPNLVSRADYLNAITLDNASVMVSRIIGAPLSGFFVGLWGTTPVLGLRALGALVAILWLSRIESPDTHPQARKETHLSNFIEGIHYLGNNRAVLTQILLYLLPFFVMNSYTGLLPYLATHILHIGPDLFGIMNAAPGVGAVIAILVLASFVNFRHKALSLVIAGIVQGIGLVLFVFSPGYFLAIVLLIVVGAATMAFMALNNTIIQEIVSDQVRGRVMSLREVAFGLGPAGSLFSGFIAAVVGVSAALGIAGGISLVALAGILIAIPRTR